MSISTKAKTRDMEFVHANGLRFAYLGEGRGPLVLLLHGFPDTARTWDHVRPRIAARGFRVVSPWMRGYHPTAIPERDASLRTLARDVLGLIEALGEESAIVVGHDWGGAAAYGAAALDPARVKRLFVVALPHPATFHPTPKLLWGVRHFLFYKLPGAARRFAQDDFAALPRIYRRWSPLWRPATEEFSAVRESFANPRSLDAAFGYYRRLPLRPPPFLLQRIEVPTVVFAGADEDPSRPSDFAGASRMFSGTYQVEPMRGGHFLHREHPEEFAARLLAHLPAGST